MKNKIIKKLSSRKLWLAVTNFVGMLIIFFGYSQDTATRVSALIMAGASVLSYIISEGWIDASAVGQTEEE